MASADEGGRMSLQALLGEVTKYAQTEEALPRARELTPRLLSYVNPAKADKTASLLIGVLDLWVHEIGFFHKDDVCALAPYVFKFSSLLPEPHYVVHQKASLNVLALLARWLHTHNFAIFGSLCDDILDLLTDLDIIQRGVFNDSKQEKEASVRVLSLRRLSQYFECCKSREESCLPLHCPSHPVTHFVLDVSSLARCDSLRDSLTKWLGLLGPILPLDRAVRLYEVLFSQVQLASNHIKLASLNTLTLLMEAIGVPFPQTPLVLQPLLGFLSPSSSDLRSGSFDDALTSLLTISCECLPCVSFKPYVQNIIDWGPWNLQHSKSAKLKLVVCSLLERFLKELPDAHLPAILVPFLSDQSIQGCLVSIFRNLVASVSIQLVSVHVLNSKSDILLLHEELLPEERSLDPKLCKFEEKSVSAAREEDELPVGYLRALWGTFRKIFERAELLQRTERPNEQNAIEKLSYLVAVVRIVLPFSRTETRKLKQKRLRSKDENDLLSLLLEKVGQWLQHVQTCASDRGELIGLLASMMEETLLFVPGAILAPLYSDIIQMISIPLRKVEPRVLLPVASGCLQLLSYLPALDLEAEAALLSQALEDDTVRALAVNVVPYFLARLSGNAQRTKLALDYIRLLTPLASQSSQASENVAATLGTLICICANPNTKCQTLRQQGWTVDTSDTFFFRREASPPLRIVCPICDAPGGRQDIGYVPMSLMEPFFSLLVLRKTPAIRSKMSSSFFRMLRHISADDLLSNRNAEFEAKGMSETPDHAPKHKFVPTHALSLNVYATMCLELLCDEDATVRAAAAQATASLIYVFNTDETQILHPDPIILLFGSPQKKSRKRSFSRSEMGDAGLKSATFASDLDNSVQRFVFELKKKADEVDESVHADVLETVFVTLGNLGCIVRGPAQATLLWMLIDSLVHPSVPLRAVAYDQIHRVANAMKMSCPELVKHHKKHIYPKLFNQIKFDFGQELFDHVCEALLDSEPDDFVEVALPDVLPYLVSGGKIDVLRVVSRLRKKLGSLQQLMVDFLHILLAWVLTEKMDWECVQKSIEFIKESIGMPGSDTRALLDLVTYETIREMLVQLGEHDLKGNVDLMDGVMTGLHTICASISNKAEDEREIYQSQREPSAKEYHDPAKLADFMHEHFLRALDDLAIIIVAKVDKFEQKPPPTLEQRHAALRSMAKLIMMCGPHLRFFIPKIMATLKGVMHEAVIRLEACKVWEAFIRTLDISLLGPFLSPIIVGLLPYVENQPKEVSGRISSILRFLLVENSVHLKAYFKEIPIVSDVPSLEEIFLSVKQEIGDVSPHDTLVQLMRLMEHESSNVKAQALSQLRLTLRHLGQTETWNLEGKFGHLIPQLVSALLLRSADWSEQVKSECARCIGELGAIDPAMLSSVMVQSKQPQQLNSNALVRELIETKLVRALRAAIDHTSAGRALFAIQDLLKFMGCDSKTPQLAQQGLDKLSSKQLKAMSVIEQNKRKQQERGIANWRLLADETKQIIYPCLSSYYVVKSEDDVASPNKEIFYEPSFTLRKWLSEWMRFLTMRADGPRAPIFQACRAVLKSEVKTGRMLLPYLIQNALLYGTETDLARISEEILAVLQSPQQMTPGQQHFDTITQAIFDLLDQLAIWMQEESCKEKKKSPETKDDVLADEKCELQVIERGMERYKELVRKISNLDLANASFRCNAYTRALKYLESHLRETHTTFKRDAEGDMKANRGDAKGLLKGASKGGLFGCGGFLGEGMTAEDIRMLQEIYSELDEPDGMSGVAALRRESTLRQQIRDLESEGDWAEAMTYYEQALQQEPTQLSHHVGLLQSLLNLGYLTTLITHVTGALSIPKSGPVLSAFGVQAAWRLCRWGTLEEFLKMGPEHSFEIGISQILLAMHKRDDVEYVKWMETTRMDVMGPLSAASFESYQRAYPFFVRLHMLTEIEQARSLPLRPDAHQLMQVWAQRFKRTQASFRIREPILSLRRVLLSMVGTDKAAGDGWLLLSREARTARQFETASGALQHAKETLGYSGVCVIEHTKLLRARGKVSEALLILERESDRSKKLRSSSDLSPEAKSDPALAKTYLLMGKWIQECGAKEAKEVIINYQEAIHLRPKWEKAYFLMGKFYDKLLMANGGADTHGVGGTSAAQQYADPIVWERAMPLLEKVTSNYGISLSKGHRYIFQTLPRLLTLWLDYGTHWLPANRTSKSRPNKPSFEAQICAFMDTLINLLEPYKWLSALPQLVSRICHTNLQIFEWLTKIMVRVFKAFPQQALWMTATRSNDEVRSRKLREIMNEVKKNVSLSTVNLIIQANSLHEMLVHVCAHAVAKQKSLSVAKQFPQILRLFDAGKPGVLVPLQSALTGSFPSAPIEDMEVEGSDHQAFPSTQVMITGFDDEIEILKSKEKPRKICLQGSDGNKYLFLAKREAKGDMRKNSRMMEFCTVINQFLKKDDESRRRNLGLRTFSVLPLTEETGLIEWVPNTAGFRPIVADEHKKIGLVTDFSKIRDLFEQAKATPGDPTKNEINLFHTLLSMYPPVFHRYYLSQFPEPTSWFTNRLIYGRSVGVWSMVGNIVGLGDRHGENILIDQVNGECVHVDFDCLFDKGLSLDCPEKVPFRLTPNMVDALGISGVDGLFRRSCEVCMKVLRDHQETLMNVLQTFVHDPLVEWKVDAQKRDANAIQTLEKIQLRLNGKSKPDSLSLNVDGQVHQLTKEATSEVNLAKMYIGWMAWI